MRPVDNCERALWSNKLDLFTTLSSVFSVIIRVTEECWLCCLLIIVKFNQDRDGYRATPQRWGQVIFLNQSSRLSQVILGKIGGFLGY